MIEGSHLGTNARRDREKTLGFLCSLAINQHIRMSFHAAWFTHDEARDISQHKRLHLGSLKSTVEDDMVLLQRRRRKRRGIVVAL